MCIPQKFQISYALIHINLIIGGPGKYIYLKCLYDSRAGAKMGQKIEHKNIQMIIPYIVMAYMDSKKDKNEPL